jgi:RNA polymerase sigma-70 factor (ECF subfamily)
MTRSPRNQTPTLTLVGKQTPYQRSTNGDEHREGQPELSVRDLDWSILMARAQDGDGEAYLRLLEAITPYLHSLAARRHRDPSDIEDAVQDVLLTVHSIRHTYDPVRPFGPWLVAIANRRFVDRLRRQGRMRAREVPLIAERPTDSEPQANMDEVSGRQELEGAVDKLPPMQRQAIRLLKLKEMSLKEAAAASGTSIASLKVATHRALKSLRKMLSDRSGT